MPARGGDRGVPPDLGIQVGMNVNKTGGDELAFGIDGPFGRAAHRADFSNAVALDGNIRVSLLAAGAVDDGPVFNDDIVGHDSSLMWLSAFQRSTLRNSGLRVIRPKAPLPGGWVQAPGGCSRRAVGLSL